MVHATIRFWDGQTWRLDVVQSENPLPVARLGEALATVSQASGNAYADVAGTTIDTLMQGAANGGYEIGAATAGVTFKVAGSLDGVNWHDLTAKDAAGADQNAVDVAVPAAAGDVLLLPGALGILGCYRYYKVQCKSSVTDTPGTGTVTGFFK